MGNIFNRSRRSEKSVRMSRRGFFGYKWLWWLVGVVVVAIVIGTAVVLYVSARLQQNLLGTSPNYTSKELFNQAVGAVDSGDYTQAEQYLESALKQEDSSDYRGQLAVVKYRLKKYAEAADQYRQLIDKKQDTAFAWNGLGNVYRDWAEVKDANKADLQGKAEAAYQASTAADKTYTAAYSNLALLLNGEGRVAEAEAVLAAGVAATGSGELKVMQGVLGR